MAAPLKAATNPFLVNHKRIVQLCFARCYAGKYWERSEDSLYETGEQRSDRYVGVPKKEKSHPETPKKGQYEINPPKGRIFDKKPFPAELKAGKRYKWCACGYSHRQPLCDGSHKKIYDMMKDTPSSLPLFQPVTFEVEKDGTYWLCNCKQTNKSPFCDGTHKQEEIQAKIKS